MKLKTLFLLIVIVFSINQIVICQEGNNGDLTADQHTKGMQLNIGGGLNCSAVFSVEHEIKNPYYENKYIYLRVQGFAVKMLIPASFIYNPAKNFGIGVAYSFGFGLTSQVNMIHGYIGYIPITYLIENRIRLINKAGNINKKNFFLIEYGLTAIGVIESSKDTILTSFRLGPGVFMGYERESKKAFAFAVGVNFDAVYERKKTTSYVYFWGGGMAKNVWENDLWDFHIGMELRWSFSKRWNL